VLKGQLLAALTHRLHADGCARGTQPPYRDDQLKVFRSAFVINLTDYEQVFVVFFFLMDYTTSSDVMQTCPSEGQR